MPNQVRASHILVKTEEEANKLHAQIQGGEDFGALAKKWSDCPSGNNCGDLGFFGRGQMVPEFEQAAFAMSPGSVSKPIKTQFGYHIIRVEEVK